MVKNRDLRAIVTEVLPHELPLIFTNDMFYLSLIEKGVPDDLAKSLSDVRQVPRSDKTKFTKPYEYSIRKERASFTNLAIMHPLSQLKAAEFYDSFAETILAACVISPASLRRPSAVARLATANELADIRPMGEGKVHVEVLPDEAELASIVSFFVYREVNLLAKFFDSQAYLNLEKKYSRLRMLDISKCFHSIYTHTVSWAIKDKSFAKTYSNMFAFEQQFDKLMQQQNYNETNGILIGPELSRIFAEVIFQRIDLNIIKKAEVEKLVYGKHYEFKRYVDDYFLYANDEETLNLVQSIVSSETSIYKMHLNDGKETDLSRPFVTQLSAAKREIQSTMFDLKNVVDDVKVQADGKIYRSVSRRVKNKTLEARLIIGEHGVGFHNVSGWTLSLLRVMAEELVQSANSLGVDEDERASLIERALWSILSLVFYIASLDVRVTTTYALAHVLAITRRRGYKKLRLRSDWIEHILLKETIDLAISAHGTFFERGRRVDAVESFNILILGAHYFGKMFTSNQSIRGILNDLLNKDLTYFSYITLKFVYLKDKTSFATELSVLNSKAVTRVVADVKQLACITESYLLLADLLSAPDLTNDEKRNLWSLVLPGTPSNAKLDHVAARCGFADWEGLRIGYLMARHRLRPVYE
jgi:hypothetical protein